MPKGLRNASGTGGGAPTTSAAVRDKNGLDDPAAYNRIAQRMLDNYNVTLQSLETVPIKTLEETMDTLAAVIDDYPMLKDSKITITGDYIADLKNYAGTRPVYSKDGSVKNYIVLNLNNYELNADQLSQKYSYDVKKHQFPQGTQYKHLIAHEAGHLIELRIIEKRYNTSRQRQKAWDFEDVSDYILKHSYLHYVPKVQRKSYQAMRKDVSKYARQSDYGLSTSETLAECISDYAANGRAAKPLSIAVRKTLKEEFDW